MIRCAGPAPPAARTFNAPEVALLTANGHPTVATPEIAVGPVNEPLPATVISDDEAAVSVAPVSEPPFVVNERSLSNWPTSFGLARRSLRTMVSVFALVANVADALSPRNSARNKSLEMLNLWRNAIAHQNFDPSKLGSTKLGLAQVRKWRIACEGLARGFDRVMRAHIRSVTEKIPWK